MKTAFNISSQNTSVINKLFIELSNEGFSYIGYHNNDILALKILRFDNGSPHAERAEAISKMVADEDVLKMQAIDLQVSLSFAESILAPAEFYNHSENVALLKELYGDRFEERLLQDDISAQGIINNYSIPVVYDSILRTHFSTAKINHQYSLLVAKLDKSKALHVLFYFEKIVVVVFKDNKLQSVQTFMYKAPADVVYHLLNISKQFNIAGLPVTVYGMIEKRSALYEEIHKYLPDISFAELPAALNTGDDFRDYPAHFFAHLFYTAL